MTRSDLRRTVLAVAVAVMVGLATAWYLRPIVNARMIGIDWRATVAKSQCVWSWKRVVCSPDGQRPGAPIPTYLTTLQINAVTRSVLFFSRTWPIADSLRWQHLIDSVTQAFANRHAHPLPCKTPLGGYPIASAWDFGSTEARLFASPVRPVPNMLRPVPAVRLPGFMMVVQLVPKAAYGCGPRWEYHVLTPTQIAQRVQEWLMDQLGM